MATDARNLLETRYKPAEFWILVGVVWGIAVFLPTFFPPTDIFFRVVSFALQVGVIRAIVGRFIRVENALRTSVGSR